MDIYSMSHQHLISDELKEKLKEVNDNFIEKYGAYLPKDDYAKETNINKYLFRGIRKDNGKWIEGGYCCCNNKSYIVIATQYIPDTRDWDTADYYEKNPVYQPTFIEVYTKTVGQWSGLTDMNDNKVFEGDIIDCWSEGVNAQGAVQRRRDGLWIIYPAWQKHIMWGLCPDEYSNTTVEVIGNVYNNPELINN